MKISPLAEATAQKIKFSVKDFFSKFDQILKYTQEIPNGKLHFLCSELELCKVVHNAKLH